MFEMGERSTASLVASSADPVQGYFTMFQYTQGAPANMVRDTEKRTRVCGYPGCIILSDLSACVDGREILTKLLPIVGARLYLISARLNESAETSDWATLQGLTWDGDLFAVNGKDVWLLSTQKHYFLEGFWVLTSSDHPAISSK